MVTPDVKRDAVAHVCAQHGVSQRRACEVLSFDRSSMRYRGVRPDDAAIREAMKTVASERRRFGYRRICRAEFFLQLYGRQDCARGAGKFHERSVAHQLDDAPAMHLYRRFQNGLQQRLLRSERAGLVCFHQARVADNVGHQDSGEAAIFGHSTPRRVRTFGGRSPACSYQVRTVPTV